MKTRQQATAVRNLIRPVPRKHAVAWACSFALVFFVLNSSWAAGEGEHAGGSGSLEPNPVGKLVLADDGNPQITFSKGEKQYTYSVAPGAVVTLNGHPVSLAKLEPGDTIKLTTRKGDSRLVERIEATRYTLGDLLRLHENELIISPEGKPIEEHVIVEKGAKVFINGEPASLDQLKAGDRLKLVEHGQHQVAEVIVERVSLAHEFWENFRKNLFKPLLLFFYMGFLVPIFKIAFEFPHVIYQGLTIYLLVSIGWKGGEELAELAGGELGQAMGFMGIGFATNFVIGIAAYAALRAFTKLRRIDAATVGAYYGSDSAGTFVTCVGVLEAAHIGYKAYMPVMLAVMEIPGCLVGLYLVSRLRQSGMDALGHMPDEPGYDPTARPSIEGPDDHGHGRAVKQANNESGSKKQGIFSPEVLHEVFLNPGIFLLFGGILIGFISGFQGHAVTKKNDPLFVDLFQGMLCLFLLEMGMTASKRLKDLKAGGWQFIAFGLIAPNIFAIAGILVAHLYSHLIHQPFQLGTYVLFSVLCAAASYIAVPAIQRIAIPEASPTLPLAASLGLTFSYNVTIGIPVYIMIAQIVMRKWAVLPSS